MSDINSYDLVILGGGAAAFAAITEADQRGLTSALINTGLPLGGTCVNVGCVPSKHLLEVGKTAFDPPRNPFEAVEYGNDSPETNWSTALDEKERLVESLREQNYIRVADRFGTDIYEGYGQFIDTEGRNSSGSRTQSGDDLTIEVVQGKASGATITGEKVLIATGSSPYILPIQGIEDTSYETSESILERCDLPERLVIIGGGYVAMEWGQILHHMGTEVTILQRSNHVLSRMASQLGHELQQWLKDEGIEVVTNVDVQRVRETKGTIGSEDDDQHEIVIEANIDDVYREFTATDLFVATGVRPNTDDIGLDEIGIETSESGAVVVDKQYRTSHRDVYAAGDCIGNPMLETVAAKEGNHAVKNAFGNERATIDYHAVPKVVFTNPEVASVGTTEHEYMAEYGTCTCRTVKMEDIPKAKAAKDTRGLVQVVKHHETDKIVGVHMVGSRAADMISEATLAVKFGLTIDDIIDTIHPFPTFSEAFKHACQAFRRDTTTMSCCVE